jgi:manganese transport system permease protein
MNLLLEPLSHAFMLRALLVSALVGGVCGLLSCYMTLKGWALMGDAVSHAVLPGVVVAYALGLPFSLGAFVFGVGSVAAIGFVKQKSRVKEDTVIGLVFTGFFALGLVLVSKTRSNIDLTHILFGNVLGINAADRDQYGGFALHAARTAVSRCCRGIANRWNHPCGGDVGHPWCHGLPAN